MPEAKTENIEQKENQSIPQTDKPPEPEKILFSWKAPARPFKRRDKQFWTTIIAIASIFGLLLYVIEGVMPVILIIAVIFLYYVLTTVEPEEITYQITNFGIKISDKGIPWVQIGRFWFTRRFSDDLLVLEVPFFPGRLELVYKLPDRKKIGETLTKHLIEEEVPPSGLDKAANWFAKKLPGADNRV